jgi:hypothetical protein
VLHPCFANARLNIYTNLMQQTRSHSRQSILRASEGKTLTPHFFWFPWC